MVYEMRFYNKKLDWTNENDLYVVVWETDDKKPVLDGNILTDVFNGKGENLHYAVSLYLFNSISSSDYDIFYGVKQFLASAMNFFHVGILVRIAFAALFVNLLSDVSVERDIVRVPFPHVVKIDLFHHAGIDIPSLVKLLLPFIQLLGCLLKLRVFGFQFVYFQF